MHCHDNIFHAYEFVTGDHAYKQSEGLPAEEQMITALPDVRTLMIDPEQDEFMVLACDGIWNFMSSQEVVDFVRPRIQGGQTKLSQICEEVKFFYVGQHHIDGQATILYQSYGSFILNSSGIAL